MNIILLLNLLQKFIICFTKLIIKKRILVGRGFQCIRKIADATFVKSYGTRGKTLFECITMKLFCFSFILQVFLEIQLNTKINKHEINICKLIQAHKTLKHIEKLTLYSLFNRDQCFDYFRDEFLYFKQQIHMTDVQNSF